MAKLLVTGGAGFIGSNFVRHWRKHKPTDDIVVLDALTYAGNVASIADIPDVDFVQGDIRDYDLVVRLLQQREIDTVVHFAAESHVDRSILGPDAFIETNVLGTHSLLKAAREVWLDQGTGRDHRFHHVSTDEVYGTLEPADPAFHENTPYAPNSPYAASKASSDMLVRAYHQTYGLKTTVSNCSNNYGPYQFPEKLIPLFLLNALSGKPLPIYGDGMQVRDWLHVEDHCLGISLILESEEIGETFCIGGGAELPNLTVIDTICGIVDELFAANPALAAQYPDAPAAKGQPTAMLKTFVKDRAGHDRRYAIDETKIATRLGYKPARNFDQGLRETIQWYLGNQTWWKNILNGSYRNWLDLNYADRLQAGKVLTD